MKEYSESFDKYRHIDEEEKERFIIKKLGELHLHQKLSRFDLSDLFMDFDATTISFSNVG